MPRKSKYKLKTHNVSKEELGLQIARLRKEKGYTQVELAKKMGITQVLISAYERGRIKPGYEIISSFAQALEVTTDELLGLKESKTVIKKPSLKILRRLNKIEQLPPSQQRALLQTIDNYLKGVEAQQ
jgi:transcriptional regulator with XRE-family HTH domain